MADNDLQFSDNFKLWALDDGERRLVCHCCGVIVFSSIDHRVGPVSLATLIDAAEDHEAAGCALAGTGADQ